MNKIAFPIFSCRWTIHAWNKKIGKFSAIAPNPRFNDAENCHFPEQLFFAHHIIARGGKGIFPIFLFQAGRKKWQISIFHIYVLCEKNVFGKQIVIFCNFSNFHFSFFLCENNIMQKNVIFTHKKCHYLSLLICGSCRIMVWMQHFRVQSSTFVANSTPPEGGGKPNSLVLAGGWGRGVGVWGGGGFVAVRHPKVASH